MKKELDENAEEQAEVKRIAAIQGIKTEGFGYVEKTVVVEGVTGGAPRAKLGIEPHSSAPKAHSGQNS